MTLDHLQRLSNYLQAEVRLVDDLVNLIPDTLPLDQRELLDNRVQKFLEYKNAKLERIKDEINWGKGLGDVLQKVGDLLLQQQSIDKALSERAEKLYAQIPKNNHAFTQGESRALVSNYVKMELAQRQGDIFWFAAYVQKQVETLLKFYFDKVSITEVNSDLLLPIDFKEYKIQTRGKLGEALFSNNSERHKVLKAIIIAGKDIGGSDAMDFSTKLKYFFWRHEYKNSKRIFNYFPYPVLYLSNARNVDSHGGDVDNVLNEKERNRLIEIRDNPGKYFIQFYQILNSVHNHIFQQV